MFEREYAFKGRHAKYVKKLCEVLFPRYVDVYILAPIVGLYYNKKASVDNNQNETAKIFAEQLVAEKHRLEFAYRLVILCDKNFLKDESLEERIKRAFSNDENIINENMQIFEEYVLGGIEVLYEKIIEEDKEDKDEYIGKFIEFIADFAEDFMAYGIDNELTNSTLIKEILETLKD
ncbi:hypothetical protein Calkro_0030 [Caldicellulosiruptor kronotskyensis 2002]|uniref:Uncharacterized protein n=1 Tax=Caldicellulosiruptor kronotskyensis (strain DSM 18902 / VKM B-2412 / 2002) TaxID=632348 RepID=E4SC23_CALK2|nr:hypothetical protein [Caldicellulosiruptor kronotskyensis]ADQ44948.1 hypothetical protein Calkro_0030 [Caldicellulosiruptor kronotskyensis 2002]